MNCEKFCRGPQNGNHGIMCQLAIGCERKAHEPKIQVMKHNPRTQEATLNLIRNGGRHLICLRNVWRHEMP